MSESPTLTPLRYPLFAAALPQTTLDEGRYEARFARSMEELDEILKLRFEVFNLELGEGLDSSYATGRDRDPFDEVCHHLLVAEKSTGRVVGTYRLQNSDMAASHLGFYSAIEFDFSSLPGEVLGNAVELGRACIARDHRNPQVLLLLWKGVALYVAHQGKRFLFGCSSLTSQDPEEGRAVMAYLEAEGHVHPELRVRPQPSFQCYDDAVPPGSGAVAVKVPKLFRIYLLQGAKICGPPAIDRDFKTIDYLILLDVEAMDERKFRMFFG